MKKLMFLSLALIPLCNGCFSTLARFPDGSPSRSTKTKAAVADVVTAPIQTPFLLAMAANTTKGPAERQRLNEERVMTAKLEANPEICITERWDLLDVQGQGKAQRKIDIHRHILVASFSNPRVAYTPQQLETIHRTMPAVRDCVFCSSSCSKDFLEAHFNAEFEKALHRERDGLMNLISNPNCSDELIERVAGSEQLPNDTANAAGRILKERRNPKKHK